MELKILLHDLERKNLDVSRYDLADYVLGHFKGEDLVLMEEGYEKAISATQEILKGEIDAAMNEYNRKVKPKEE